jgi:hypothetical protein
LQNWEERTQQGENYNKKDKTHVQYELQWQPLTSSGTINSNKYN